MWVRALLRIGRKNPKQAYSGLLEKAPETRPVAKSNRQPSLIDAIRKQKTDDLKVMRDFFLKDTRLETPHLEKQIKALIDKLIPGDGLYHLKCIAVLSEINSELQRRQS